MAEPVRERAPAKINPYLRVLGKRNDGYHDIETLILPITLGDVVTVTGLDDHLIWVMNVGGPAKGEDPPTGSSNLAHSATDALRKVLERTNGAQITIEKRIPIAAGLGGGSADAAATLRALGKIWGAGPAQLARVAEQVGSDVPAMLRAAPLIARGRGESVERVDVPSTWWVLVTQPFSVRSADAYRWWDEDGKVTGPDPRPVLDALTAADLERASPLLFNDLEKPVSTRHPEVASAREQLLSAGALGAVMSGSGPTVAGLFPDEYSARGAGSSLGSKLVHVVEAPGSDADEDAWAKIAAPRKIGD